MVLLVMAVEEAVLAEFGTVEAMLEAVTVEKTVGGSLFALMTLRVTSVALTRSVNQGFAELPVTFSGLAKSTTLRG